MVEALPTKSPPFWQQVFDGSLLVQLTRAAIWSAAAIALLLSWIVAAISFQERRRSPNDATIENRRQVIAEYMKGKTQTSLTEWATNEFLKHGNQGLTSWANETPVISDGTGIVYPPPLDVVCNPLTQTLKAEPLAEINRLRDFIREKYGSVKL